jgi:hypothetical protein
VITSLACGLPSLSRQATPTALPKPTDLPSDTVITITEQQLLSTLLNFSQGDSPIKLSDVSLQLADGECHLIATVNMEQAATGNSPAVSMHGKVDSRFSLVMGAQSELAIDFRSLTLNNVPVPTFMLNGLDKMISAAISSQLQSQAGEFVLKDILIGDGQMTIRVGTP